MCKFNVIAKIFFNTKLIATASMIAVLMMGFQTAHAEGGKTGGIEIVYPLKITLDTEKLEGFIMYRLCHWDAAKNKRDCKAERLLITPQTKAYANNKQVPLRQAKGRLGRHASVEYYVDTLVVESISW